MDNEQWAPVQPLGDFNTSSPSQTPKILDNPVVVQPGSTPAPRTHHNHHTFVVPHDDAPASTPSSQPSESQADEVLSGLQANGPESIGTTSASAAPVQPSTPASQPVAAGGSLPATPGLAPLGVVPTVAGSAPAGSAPVSAGPDIASLIKTIVIVVLSLATVTFVALFIWRSIQYDDISTDVNGQISTAVAEARAEQALKDEAEFAEREKDPYRTFSGPADYGQLSFEYPKTWSVYVASDAAKGGDYHAYFNPIEVNAVSNTTINALRVSILDKAFDTVATDYQRYLERKDSNLSVEAITVGGTAANRYTGTIPDTELNGVIVIFKIRDKTAVLQTDSVLFIEDFNRLLSTIEFNA